MKTAIATIGTTLAGLAFSGMAMAQATAPDTSAATDAFGAVEIAVVAIGVAMLAAAGAGIVYRWVTAFLLK